jgi:hypothetical protein
VTGRPAAAVTAYTSPLPAGLTAIGGAFASGEIFVRNGKPAASLAMALLTGMAPLCYIGALAQVSTALRRRNPSWLGNSFAPSRSFRAHPPCSLRGHRLPRG